MPYLECRHIFAGGRKCKAPALTGQPLCYFHDRAARVRAHPEKALPYAGTLARSKTPIPFNSRFQRCSGPLPTANSTHAAAVSSFMASR